MSLVWKVIDDEHSWELFVLQYSPQALFQSWMWGEVQKRLGVTINRFGFFENNVLQGVMQVALTRARRGSFLHVRHGPIFTKNTRKYWKTAIQFLTLEAKRQGCWFLRVSPLVPPSREITDLLEHLHTKPAAIHRMDGEYCWVLELSILEEQLLSQMRKTTRYEIKRAERDGVEIFTTTDTKYLSEFFDLYSQTSVRHGFVPHSGIAEEFAVFSKKNQAALYIGKHNGKTVAAAIVLYYGSQAIYHHGASVANKIPVSYALQWEAIKEAKKRGMKVYNFWGIAPQDSLKHPWRGITLFKKGFGGHELEYIHAQDIAISPFYHVSRTIETIRRMVRGYD